MIWHVAGKDPKANDSNSGRADAPLKTIQAAAMRAEAGDTVYVHPGIYREWVQPMHSGSPGEPIRFEANPGTVFVRGSEILPERWVKTSVAGVYEMELTGKWLEPESPFRQPLRNVYSSRSLGQIFVDGEMWHAATSKEALGPRSWALNENGDRLRVQFGADGPNGRVVEATLRRRVFSPQRRGMGYIHVIGFVFEHAANESAGSFWEPTGTQQGIVGFRSGHHFLFERNVVRFAQTVGLDFGFEGGRQEKEEPYDGVSSDHVIRDNDFTDNGECGLCGLRSHRVKILGNRIERNNTNGSLSVEEAGLKTHYFYDGLIEGNLVRDNECAGIWLDNVWRGSRVTRNVVLNNVGYGIFIELGADKGTVDHNVVGLTRAGDGIYLHDSSDVVIAHNMVVQNAHFGVYVRLVAERDVERAEGPPTEVEASRNRIWGNLFVDNFRGHVCVPGISPRSKDNFCDYNLYLNGTQWQWEGLGFHRFVVNGNDGRIPDAELYTRYVAATSGKAQPIDESRWVQQPYLSFEEWKAMTGFDAHSVAPPASRITGNNIGYVTKGSLQLASRFGTFFLRVKNEESLLAVAKDERFQTDFFGKPRRQATSAGPFDVLKVGENVMNLWPLPVSP